jgi:ribosome biogenesis GTPase
MDKKKRNKLRIALRKNKQRKARESNLTHRVLDEGLDAHDFAAGERVSGKGALTRHRTIIAAEADEAGHVLREVDESQCLRGRVLCTVGLHSVVQADGGRRYECAVRAVLRKMASDQRSVVVAGDHVLFRPETADQGVIERVAPRRGVFSRESQGREHILVANVDQVLVVVSAADPPLKPGLIDRFLISAEKGGVRSVICINKCDLVDRAALQPIAGLYSRLGYDVVLTSAATSFGIAHLRSLLRDRQTAVSGQSGVGKSSLLNAVQPHLELRTGEVSDWTGKGRHTTRQATLLPLDFGGWVVDTPGVRQFGLWDVIPEEVEGFFVEFRPFVAACKFPDCSHTHEDGCAVKRAVEHDLIAPLRYESYVRIISGDPA